MNPRPVKLRSWYERLKVNLGLGDGARPRAAAEGSGAVAGDAPPSALEEALGYLQQGKLDQAESIYRAILEKQPAQAEALHLMGVVQAQHQNLAEAAELIGRALELDPDNSAAHLNLGNVLKALKRNEDALASYDQALVLNPDSAEGLNNRGAALGELGRHDEALASYERALSLNSGYMDALLNRGISLVALGRYPQALESYDRVLAIDSDHIVALVNRSLTLSFMGRYREALEGLDRVLTISPLHAEAHANRGSVLAFLDRREEALASYDRALAIHPDNADALFNRGNVLGSLARHDAALTSYDRVLAIMPDHHVALLKRCATLFTLRRFDVALTGYDRALAGKANDLEVLCNRGLVLVELKRYADAVDSYDKAIAINPDFVEVLYSRGLALSHLMRYEDAIASYDRVLALRPDYAEAYFCRGIALVGVNRKDEAVASYDRAIAQNPQFMEALYNRAILLADMWRFDEALAGYDRVLEIDPDFKDALSNRGGAFRSLALYDRAGQDYSRLIELDPEYEYALGNKLNADMQMCNWVQYQSIREKVVDAVRVGRLACVPFAFLAMSDSGAAQLQCSRTEISFKYPAPATSLWTGERYGHEKIRIAYLSADMHHHVVTELIGELFEKHDQTRFEISAWSLGPDIEDDVRKNLRKSFSQFNEVSRMTDLEVATMLRAREIDIAVDLNGFTRGCRLAIFAKRAVPIQVNYLGYIGTLGAAYMDYIIGDDKVIPKEHEVFYTEKVVRLPDTFMVNHTKRLISERTPSRAEAGLPESGFVFCCFNNNYKITPDIFDIWMRLLKRVDGGVLWLVAENALVSRNLRLEAEARGVCADRLVFAPRTPMRDHFARYRHADLFLDTPIYNAGASASDALWMGVPVVTCAGNVFVARMAASLLRAVGLPELITENLVDYEALAIKLATNTDFLADITARLVRNRTTCPLFDIDRFRRHIESAYITMHERYQRGEPPQGFSVRDVPL